MQGVVIKGGQVLYNYSKALKWSNLTNMLILIFIKTGNGSNHALTVAAS